MLSTQNTTVLDYFSKHHYHTNSTHSSTFLVLQFKVLNMYWQFFHFHLEWERELSQTTLYYTSFWWERCAMNTLSLKRGSRRGGGSEQPQLKGSAVLFREIMDHGIKSKNRPVRAQKNQKSDVLLPSLTERERETFISEEHQNIIFCRIFFDAQIVLQDCCCQKITSAPVMFASCVPWCTVKIKNYFPWCTNYFYAQQAWSYGSPSYLKNLTWNYAPVVQKTYANKHYTKSLFIIIYTKCLHEIIHLGLWNTWYVPFK